MRVLLAMSGGVDSSVAAVLLKEQGYDVVGLFMRTGVHHPTPDSRQPTSPSRGCCSAVDAGDARRVADRLDIPFYAFDFEEDFGRIIDYFADEYLAGRTPNPCVQCNTWLKFGKLWDFAQQIGADRIATGHYARAENGSLYRAADPDKDQSYVLFGIQREILDRLLFPLGGMRKADVRALAREHGLGVAEKPDSVEICFVPDGDHAKIVKSRRPEMVTAGQIVDESGQVLGEHDGYERYTIGQRKGLGIAATSRRYVLEIIPETRTVVLGDPEHLRANGLEASRVNWLTDLPSRAEREEEVLIPSLSGRGRGGLRCEAKIRYRHTPTPATVTPTADGGAIVHFDETQTAVTPGQAVVFYDGDRVLGGGWIEKAIAP
ncbi:MAG: tRNA 2-thiouridine(34) synthase MnmA [Gemmataceae bacterium]